MIDPTPEALVIELEAQKIADAVCENYSIRKHSLEWAMCKASALQALRTSQLAPVQQPSGDVVEAVAELQLAAFLAGRGSVTGMKHGTRTAKPAPTMDQFRQMARAALGEKP